MGSASVTPGAGSAVAVPCPVNWEATSAMAPAAVRKAKLLFGKFTYFISQLKGRERKREDRDRED